MSDRVPVTVTIHFTAASEEEAKVAGASVITAARDITGSADMTATILSGELDAMQSDLEAIAHSQRFRKVSTRYPLCVTEAYGGDTARAAADSDEQVAVTVAAWEREQGLEPRDWQAIGREERDEG
jgi:hypothetical protein